jgi:hypothetical protein
MDMTAGSCWDCPITLVSVFGHLVLTTAVVMLGLWFLRSRFATLRALGVVTAVIGFVLALMFTFTVPRWGIINPFTSQLSVFSRGATFTLYFLFDAAVLVALVWSSRWEARHPLERRESRSA